MFAIALVLERTPMTSADVPDAVFAWVQDVGGFALAALVIWVCVDLLRRAIGQTASEWGSTGWTWRSKPFVLALLLAIVGYSVGVGVKAREPEFNPQEEAPATPQDTLPIKIAAKPPKTLGSWLVFAGGFCALTAVCLPFFVDLPRLRLRRIWALAKLSFKEALRRRVLWGFSGLLIVFLFAGWFVPYKPEQQVSTYVRVVYWSMTPLLLVTAGLLAAFSIPSDIRSQTIHTIVTKPVERFEIVLGRFLGYTLLMTLVLVAMTLLSLLYVFRGVDPDAAFESLRARVPLYGGKLEIWDPRGQSGGVSVGREWDYRSYILGGRKGLNYAVWQFDAPPRQLANPVGGRVPLEFSFDIYRSHKGEENKGILCRINVESWRWNPTRKEASDRLKNDEEQLAERYGVYAPPAMEIFDFHTVPFSIPAGVFKNHLASREEILQGAEALKRKGKLETGEQEELAALERDAQRLQEWEQRGEKRPPLQIFARCESTGQYLGVAKGDLYMLLGEKTVAVNFFKCAAGLWFLLCLVIGLAVACSTYLSGIISGLVTMFLFIGGFFSEYIQSLSQGQEQGGGPGESLIRLANQLPLAAQIEQTPAARVATFSDEAFRWGLRRFVNVLPDVNRFFLTDYLASGFDINEVQLLVDNVLPLAGYLLPWAILAYYLMKTREVATW